MISQISLLLFLLVISPKSNDYDNPSTISFIPLPPGYKRLPVQANSFETYLRGILLKADKKVYLLNKQKKRNQAAQYAVLDIHVVLNVNENVLSPWYSIPYELLKTPELTFIAFQLHTWP